MNIPTKQLIQALDIVSEPLMYIWNLYEHSNKTPLDTSSWHRIVSEPLMYIWNNEIIQNNTFPTKLKLADIKKLENIFVESYRPIGSYPQFPTFLNESRRNKWMVLLQRIYPLPFVDTGRDLIVNMLCWQWLKSGKCR